MNYLHRSLLKNDLTFSVLRLFDPGILKNTRLLNRLLEKILGVPQPCVSELLTGIRIYALAKELQVDSLEMVHTAGLLGM